MRIKILVLFLSVASVYPEFILIKLNENQNTELAQNSQGQDLVQTLPEGFEHESLDLGKEIPLNTIEYESTSRPNEKGITQHGENKVTAEKSNKDTLRPNEVESTPEYLQYSTLDSRKDNPLDNKGNGSTSKAKGSKRGGRIHKFL